MLKTIRLLASSRTDVIEVAVVVSSAARGSNPSIDSKGTGMFMLLSLVSRAQLATTRDTNTILISQLVMSFELGLLGLLVLILVSSITLLRRHVHAPEKIWKFNPANWNRGEVPAYKGPLIEKLVVAPAAIGKLVA